MVKNSEVSGGEPGDQTHGSLLERERERGDWSNQKALEWSTLISLNEKGKIEILNNF